MANNALSVIGLVRTTHAGVWEVVNILIMCGKKMMPLYSMSRALLFFRARRGSSLFH